MSNFFKTKIAGEQILDGAVTRQNLETSIVSDIDTLKQNDVTKASDIAELQTDLSAEEAARVSADAALGIRVDGVEGDLAAEVTRAQAAEAQVLSDANSYTDTRVADLVNSAPAVLDTLKELSDALGEDPNFSVTVSNMVGEIAADLTAEETRALAAEAALGVRIDGVEGDLASEITRATGVEAGLASDIAAEEAARVSADAALGVRVDGVEADLASEITRATGVEAGLASDIAAEETRALAAEAALGVRIDGVEGDLASEITRATGVEAGLASDIADEETRALAAESALGVRIDGVEGDLTAEVTRAISAEAVLTADLSTEVTRAQGAESALSVRIDVLEQDPTTKGYVDQKVADLVNSAPAVLDTLKELSDALGEDPNFSVTVSNMVGEVSADLASEETRALAAEAALGVRIDGVEGDLASEETRALAAEAALGVRVDGVEVDLASEETRALAAEAALGVRVDGVEADVAAEETRALAAEAALGVRIDGVEGDLASEETRALAAEAALGVRIDGVEADVTAEETRALAAEAALGVRIDGVEGDLATEITDRESADTALSGRISALEADATTKTYVDQKFAEVIDNAPQVLDTLNELAQAIGDDPDFITNINSSIDAVEASVTAEETRALAAEAALGVRVDGVEADIAAEETRALAAESALGVRIDGVEADIAAEETRALIAEGALQTDILALDNRVTTLEDSVYIIREVPSGLVNDSNTVFQLDSAPTAGSEQVFLNGILQEAGVSGDYTISGDTITFGVAPKAGYTLFVNYVTGAPVFNLGSGSSSGFSGDYNDLINKPTLFSGSYNDLTNKPSLFSGDYNDLANKPSIPSLTSVESRITSLEADATTKTYVDQQVAGIVNSAPAVLDTLNELAQAIGSDPSFATTVANSIGAISSRVTTLENVSFATVATSGSYNDLTNKPTLFSGDYTDLTNKPTLFSGSYNDLTNKPTLFSGAYADLTGKPTLATVATSGSYSDLSNKPTIPSALDDLSDVVITSASKGQIVAHNGTSFVNTNTIEASAAAVKPLILKGAASQSANLFETQNSSGTTLTYVSSSGLLNTYLGYVNNIYIGYRNANRNTFLGERSGESNAANAQDSVAVGFEAARYNSSGYENVVVGKSAMGAANSTAYRNTAVGFFAGAYMTSGSSNTLVGHLAANAITTGSSNVVLGKDAATTLTTGAQNVAIGTSTVLSITDSNQIAIGNAATTSGASALAIGVSASAAANCMDIRFGGASRITGDSSGNVAVAKTLHAGRYTETVSNAFNTALAPSSGTLTVDTSTGNCVLGGLNASVSTWAFTNVPTDNSKVTTVTAVLAGNASYTYGDACSVNGSAVSGGIMWSGGTAPTATSGTDIVTFVIVKDSAGTVKVFGSATTNFS